jgi:hypothetical protein
MTIYFGEMNKGQYEFYIKRNLLAHKKAIEYQKKYDIKHKKEVKARLLANNAEKLGLLKKECCQLCGIKERDRPMSCRNIIKHHPDYNKPLEIVWLCRSCHKQLHCNLKKEKLMAKLKQKSQKTERTQKILDERKTGKSIDTLASIFNISRARIYQILKDNGDTLPNELRQS